MSDSLLTFPQFNASLADEFEADSVSSIDIANNSNVIGDVVENPTVEERYINLISQAYIKMNTYNAALVPEDRLHVVCMFDGDDGTGSKNHHNVTYMRMKKELTHIWFPYKSKHFPSVASSSS